MKEALAEHAWPGNVRELQHAMERAVIMSPGSEIELADLPDEVAHDVSAARSESSTEKPAPEDIIQVQGMKNEEARIRKALDLSKGSKVRAAKLLGISRTTLWRRMRSFGLWT